MSQAILCPQCDKKFSLPDKPPATYTCTGCGTLMDLAAFGGADRKPKPKPPAKPEPGATAAGRSRSGSSRRPASRRSKRPARTPPPGRGAPAGGRGGQPRAGRREEPFPVGGVIIAVVAVVALIVIVSTKGDDPAPAPADRRSSASTNDSGPAAYTPPPRQPVVEAPPPKPPPRVPRNRRDGRPSLRGIDVETHPWLESVSADTRARVDEAIRKIYIGGRDGVEAREYLVSQGRPIAGRLISEFKAIQDNPGFDNREGASRASAMDGTLRQIDGWLERECKQRDQIRAWGAYAAPSFIERIAKYWTLWWIHEEWKDHPREPWDPMADESDETPDGFKPPEESSEEEKPKYPKPAGR